MSNLNNLVNMFTNDIAELVTDSLKDERIETILNTDGRLKGASECCKKGSFIYFLYDKNNEIIYIGESGQTIKNRLYTDGSGSHCNKEWFNEVKSLKYYKNNEMDFNSRKLIERALIKKYNPKYNDGKLKKEK
ncbi:GIY-YIG nuclease family protein [Clostridium sp. JNZ J1-5]